MVSVEIFRAGYLVFILYICKWEIIFIYCSKFPFWAHTSVSSLLHSTERFEMDYLLLRHGLFAPSRAILLVITNTFFLPIHSSRKRTLWWYSSLSITSAENCFFLVEGGVAAECCSAWPHELLQTLILIYIS